MGHVIVKYFFVLATLWFLPIFIFAQTKTTISESLLNVSDSLLQSEIASFTQKGNSLKPKDSSFRTPLIEIPIRYCSDKEVDLWWSTFFGSVSTFIHIYLKEESSVKKLDSIFLVTHSHFWVKFPKEAYNGIFTSTPCSFSGGKKGKLFSPHYKAFYSPDKRRLYIYMLGGRDTNRQEVTWVIVNDKYFTRVLDDID